MTIRRKYWRDNRQMEIDQHYEMAALARQDGDMKDYERHMKKIEDLRQQ